MSMEQPDGQPRDSVEDAEIISAPVAADNAAADLNNDQTGRAGRAPRAALETAPPRRQKAALVETPVDAGADNAVAPMVADAAVDTIFEVESPRAPAPFDPRRRLRELLAIPDRDRSDALWDELIELEIQLAPGNRAPQGAEPGRQAPNGRFAGQSGRRPNAGGMPRQNNFRPQHGPNGQPAQNAAPGTPGAARPAKRFFKKIRRNPRPAG
jgi:hypothetical protein